MTVGSAALVLGMAAHGAASPIAPSSANSLSGSNEVAPFNNTNHALMPEGAELANVFTKGSVHSNENRTTIGSATFTEILQTAKESILDLVQYLSTDQEFLDSLPELENPAGLQRREDTKEPTATNCDVQRFSTTGPDGKIENIIVTAMTQCTGPHGDALVRSAIRGITKTFNATSTSAYSDRLCRINNVRYWTSLSKLKNNYWPGTVIATDARVEVIREEMQLSLKENKEFLEAFEQCKTDLNIGMGTAGGVVVFLVAAYLIYRNRDAIRLSIKQPIPESQQAAPEFSLNDWVRRLVPSEEWPAPAA